MASNSQTEIARSDGEGTPFAGIDPWAALQDGRRQLTAALDACDPRSGARTLAIPEFANLGETAGTLNVLLLAHAARDRAHATFFASLDAIGAVDRANADGEPDSGDWSAVREEVEAARVAMLEAAAGLASEHWERHLSPPWVEADGESLVSLLVIRAMCDGILADAVAALAEDDPVS